LVTEIPDSVVVVRIGAGFVVFDVLTMNGRDEGHAPTASAASGYVGCWQTPGRR